jgi:hypothetical protein
LSLWIEPEALNLAAGSGPEALTASQPPLLVTARPSSSSSAIRQAPELGGFHLQTHVAPTIDDREDVVFHLFDRVHDLVGNDEAINRNTDEPQQRQPEDHVGDLGERGVLTSMAQDDVPGLEAARHREHGGHAHVGIAGELRGPGQRGLSLKRGCGSAVERRRVEGGLKRIANLDRRRRAVDPVSHDEQHLVPDQRGFLLGKSIGEVVPDEERTDDAALIVSHGRDAHLEELVPLVPNAVPSGAVLEDCTNDRHLVEERFAEHAIWVGIAGDDATRLVDDRHDVRPLSATPGWILEPFRDLLCGFKRPPTSARFA